MLDRPLRRLGGKAPKALASMPEQGIRVLAGIRTVGLWALEPVDYIARLINHKTHFPPLRIRRQAGPLGGLESSGAEFFSYLKLLCDLSPTSHILDIGCGFGLLALHLKDYLIGSGRYVGIDVDRRAVRWATRNVSRKNPQCEFRFLDIRNQVYNPSGLIEAGNVTFPLEPSSFDVILLKSVFTHLRPEATKQYLSEVQRLLSPGGVCLATFFVLEHAADGSRTALDFKFGNAHWRYAIRNMPELAIANSEHSIEDMSAAAGLAIEASHPGTWSGRAGGLSYQDVVLLRRAVAPDPIGVD